MRACLTVASQVSTGLGPHTEKGSLLAGSAQQLLQVKLMEIVQVHCGSCVTQVVTHRQLTARSRRCPVGSGIGVGIGIWIGIEPLVNIGEY
jgi:hypothetical protein